MINKSKALDQPIPYSIGEAWLESSGMKASMESGAFTKEFWFWRARSICRMQAKRKSKLGW